MIRSLLERTVLGAIMQDNALIRKAVSLSLAPTSFKDTDNQNIFAAMLRLDTSGSAIDELTVKFFLEEVDAFSSNCVQAVIEDIPSTSVNFNSYVNLLVESA